MAVTYWSFILAIIALAISIWNRIESYNVLHRQQKNERAKRVGEALVAAQFLKNNSINLKDFIIPEFNKMLIDFETEKIQIVDFVKQFENLTMIFERGKNMQIDTSATEALIAHFNQRRILAEYDIRSFDKLAAKKEIFK